MKKSLDFDQGRVFHDTNTVSISAYKGFVGSGKSIPRRLKAYDVIRDNGPSTTKMVAKFLGLESGQVTQVMEDLQEKWGAAQKTHEAPCQVTGIEATYFEITSRLPEIVCHGEAFVKMKRELKRLNDAGEYDAMEEKIGSFLKSCVREYEQFFQDQKHKYIDKRQNELACLLMDVVRDSNRPTVQLEAQECVFFDPIGNMLESIFKDEPTATLRGEIAADAVQIFSEMHQEQ